MSLWAWARRLDERAGLRPRKGPFDCGWCEQDDHVHCTGRAVRARVPGFSIAALHRLGGESDRCACWLRQHEAREAGSS